MNKSLIAIVVIAVLGLALLGVAAQMLSENSPKVRVKVAIERELPTLRIRAIETAIDPATKLVTQRIRVEAREAETVITTQDLEVVAVRALRVIESPDLPLKLGFDFVEVTSASAATPRWERAEVEARALLLDELHNVAEELSHEWNTPPPRLRILGDRKAYGAAVPERPAGDRTDEAIAAAVWKKLPQLRYVDLPSRTPGAPPVRIERKR